MKDIEIRLEHRPGALAEAGEALGRAGVSIEGGGAFVVDGHAVAHFLFEDADAARRALESAGIRVAADRDVVVVRLRQDVPGQLGLLTRQMAAAGVNIEALYSDHRNRLILVASDFANAQKVAATWLPGLREIEQGERPPAAKAVVPRDSMSHSEALACQTP
jgi:hypothetical protein